MRMISIALLIMIALPVAANALESSQWAVQPIWLREYHVGSWSATGYDTSFVMATENLDIVTVTNTQACSLRVWADGAATIWNDEAIYLPLATVTDLAIQDIDSLQVFKVVAGPTTLVLTVMGQKR